MLKDKATAPNGGKTKRTNLHLTERDYTKLRSALILKNMSVSEWMRIQIQKFLDQEAARTQQQV